MSERQDNLEWANVQRVYGVVTVRCAGGRIVGRDFVCVHCDSVNPDNVCKKPRRKPRRKL